MPISKPRFLPTGRPGEFTDVTRAYVHLSDSIDHETSGMTFVQACDLVDATLRFQWRYFWVPAPLMLVIVYVRRLMRLGRRS